MSVRVSLMFAATLLGAVRLTQAQPPASIPPDAYQIGYATNLLIGDAVLNITNAGTRNGFDPQGGICANVYSFDPSEELVSCCSCYVTPDGLRSLSFRNDVLTNLLTPLAPQGIVIKLLASTPTGSNGSTCDPSTPTASTLESGMRAWMTTLHQDTFTITLKMTENPFTQAVLSDSELQKLTTFCGFFKAVGSNFGICKSCRVGGNLGGVTP